MEAHPTNHSENSEEITQPVYRVNFWVQPAGLGWNLEAWYLTDCPSVHEAIEWADTNAHSRPYELFAESAENGHSEPRRAPLVRLSGQNPNDGPAAFSIIKGLD